jgi:hypothetical protein
MQLAGDPGLGLEAWLPLHEAHGDIQITLRMQSPSRH